MENEFGKAFWTKDIRVGPCLANVNFTIRTINDTTIEITNQSQSPTTPTYLWQFGDGTQTVFSGTTLIKTYRTSGTYNIVLTATNACGDNSFMRQQIIRKLPTVKTVSAANFNGTRTTVFGEVTDNGGNPIIERGICWINSLSLPTTANPKVTTNPSLGTYGIDVTPLSPNTRYVARAYAITSAGTAYGDTISFMSSYSIRMLGPAKGFVFYDKGGYSNGWRYLEAASVDQALQSPWGCRGTSISGLLTNYGDGFQNTTRIVSICSAPTIAARICNNLILNSYDDWFLPNRIETSAMYTQLRSFNVGSFRNVIYHTSQEASNINSVGINFQNGAMLNIPKSDSVFSGVTVSVRAIRRF